jgi:hypothetical protein
MAEELLDGADVVTIFEQMRGERMAECVAARPLRQTGEADGDVNGALHTDSWR